MQLPVPLGPVAARQSHATGRVMFDSDGRGVFTTAALAGVTGFLRQLRPRRAVVVGIVAQASSAHASTHATTNRGMLHSLSPPKLVRS